MADPIVTPTPAAAAPEGTAIPKAPDLFSATAKVKQVLADNPTQATQIMTAIGVFKKAKQGGYNQYKLLCSSLGVEPASQERYEAHDKAIFRELISAQLAVNMPNANLTPADIDLILQKSDGSDPLEAGKAILEVVMKGLGAQNDVIKSWTDLGAAALNLFT